MLIGSYGSVELQREWPLPLFVPDTQVVRLSGGNRLLIRNDGWLNGQRVLISNAGGMPFSEPGEDYPPYPDILRFWGVPGDEPPAGPTSQHRGSGNGIFWYNTANGDLRPFWESADTVGLVEQITAYISRDGLDRASFYRTEEAALTRDSDELYKLYAAPFGSILLAPSPVSPPSSYTSALLSEERRQPAVPTETELTPLPAAIQAVYDDTSLRDWKYFGTISSYQVETDAKMLDTAAIGEDFGDYQKGLITGAGNLNSLFRRQVGDLKLDARDLLRIVHMTDTGSRARVRFALNGCKEQDDGINSVYLEGRILIGRGSLSVAASDAIELQTDFVVVKDASGRGLTPIIGSLD